MDAPDIKITQEKQSPEESEEEEQYISQSSGSDQAYTQGKLEIIQGVNQTLKIFWEVWRNSLPFKTEIMKIIYLAINQDRPKFLSEIIIKSLELKGPTPKLFDIKHLTPVLSSNTPNEIYADASFLV